MANTAKAGIEFVDNVGRRTWDKDEYKRKAEERVALQGEDGSSRPRIAKEVVQRAPLKARETLVNLESRLGKTQIVITSTPLAMQGGFYCDVCECVVKDSSNYLDHINGKKHTRAMGMSLKAERAMLEQVRKRLAENKKKQLLAKSNPKAIDPEVALEQRLDKLRKEEEEEKSSKRQRRIDDLKQDSGEEDEELTEMGLPQGFGTSKKKR
jgi:U4/U6.U5 tri-snRNP component SNU23